MADVKISELPEATSVATPDVTAIVQGGITKKADVSLFVGSVSSTASLNLNSSGNTNDATTHPYTYQNSGIIVTDANGVEVFRLWASDPDPAFGNFNTWNLYIGYQSGLSQGHDQDAGSGFANTGIGYQTLPAITLGAFNIAIGPLAALTVTEGNGNIGIGFQALGSNLGGLIRGVTTGNYNVGIGFQAMPEDASGTSEGNVAIGYRAGELVNGDQHCVFIGHQSGPASGGLNNAIAIGYQCIVPFDNLAVIGNPSITDVYFGGQTQAASKLHGKGDAIVFPDSDPHVAGAAYWVAGVLTKSAG